RSGIPTARPTPPLTSVPYATLFRSVHARGARRGRDHLLEFRAELEQPRDDAVLAGAAGAGDEQNCRFLIASHARSKVGKRAQQQDRKSTRLNSSHVKSSYAVRRLRK